MSSTVIRLFPSIMLLSGALFGMLFPSLATSLKSTIPVWLGILMFFSSLQIRKPKLTISPYGFWLIPLILTAIFILVPGLMFLAGKLFKLSDQDLSGLVLVAAAPPVVSSPYLTKLINGDIEISFTIMFVSTLISPLMLPIAALLFLGTKILLDVLLITRVLILVIIFPTLVAMLLNRYRPEYAKKLILYEDIFTFSAILMNNWIIIGLNAELLKNFFSNDTYRLFILAVLLDFGILALVYFVSKPLLQKRKAIALAISLSIKNGALIGGAVATVKTSLSLASAVLSFVTILVFLLFVIWRDLSGEAKI